MANKPEGLLPVRYSNKFKAVEGYVGKMKKVPVIMSVSGDVVSSDIPSDWALYMEKALNNYEAVSQEQFERNDITISEGVVCSIKIPHVPVPLTLGKTIIKDEEGNFRLSSSKEYSRRIREVLKLKKELTRGLRNIPIDFPVHVKCTFYINKKNKQFCIPEITTATLDLLVRLGILKSKNSRVVYRTDGSTVQYVLGEPYTSVVIRKMRDEFID